MAVAGTVLNAANLEPVKGMLVGLHANLADSAFTKLPLSGWGVRTVADASLSVEWLPASIAFMPCRMPTRILPIPSRRK